jgi:hypothetical protein
MPEAIKQQHGYYGSQEGHDFPQRMTPIGIDVWQYAGNRAQTAGQDRRW